MRLPVPVQETLAADLEGSSQSPGRELGKKQDTGKSLSLQTSTILKAAAGLAGGFPLLSLLLSQDTQCDFKVLILLELLIPCCSICPRTECTPTRRLSSHRR